MEQEFLDEYDEITSTLERLYKDVTIDSFRRSIKNMLDDFEMSFYRTKEECEESLMEEKNKEIKALSFERDKERL